MHLLGAAHAELARTFATSGIDRFAAPTRWGRLPTGEPVLDGAAAWLRISLERRHPAGGSHLVIGRVEEVGLAETSGPDALTRIRMHVLLRKLCEVHKPAVLLVTHDVDEAIVLADRVILLDDGVVRTDVRVDLQHRSPTDPKFAELRAFLLDQLGVNEEPPQPASGDLTLSVPTREDLR